MSFVPTGAVDAFDNAQDAFVNAPDGGEVQVVLKKEPARACCCVRCCNCCTTGCGYMCHCTSVAAKCTYDSLWLSITLTCYLILFAVVWAVWNQFLYRP